MIHEGTIYMELSNWYLKYDRSSYCVRSGIA